MSKRTVFFISDRTGITAEALGRSLLTQFEGMDLEEVVIPYVDSEDKAQAAVMQINEACTSGQKAIVFSTVVNPAIQQYFHDSEGLFLDFFSTYVKPLEQEFQMASSYTIGRSHSIKDMSTYDTRIEAINYALACDDGAGVQHYSKSDLILVGVSRSGKTPTCLYLALQFGIKAANYPITPDDLEHLRLPDFLRQNRKKLFGLTLGAERLIAIRGERRPGSDYASASQCRQEIKEVEAFFKREQVPYLDTTSRSIEELSTTILQMAGLKRHFVG